MTRIVTALLATLAWACSLSAAAQADAPQHLRIVGGLAGVNQYTRHEEPFWTTELPRLARGKLSAEIVPFDRAGIRGQEMLRLIQLGVVPFGTALLSVSSAQEPELSAPDLAGLNPDIATLRRVTTAFRPTSRSACASASASSCWRSTSTRRRWCSATSRSLVLPACPGGACERPTRASPTWSRPWARFRCPPGLPRSCPTFAAATSTARSPEPCRATPSACTK
jgi:hypothetical protein